MAGGETFPIGALSSLAFDNKDRTRTFVHYSFGDAAEDEASNITKPPAANEYDVSINLLRALANLVDNVTRQDPRLDPYSSRTIPVHSAISAVLFDRETIFWKVLENQFSMKTGESILFLDDTELFHRVRADHAKNDQVVA